MPNYSFGQVVAARTRTAAHILSSPELLEKYIANGGLALDLEVIVESGRAAELANSGQSLAGAHGAADSVDVQFAFRQLQRDYKAIMSVARAVLDDLEEAKAPTEVIEALKKILTDETAVHIKTVTGEGDAKVRKALKKQSQESIRAEIWKDAKGLLSSPELLAALTVRRVDAARLTQLRDAADMLSARLSARIADKAERKLATQAEHDAVKAQRKKWGAVYRILLRLEDERLRTLLADCSR